MKTIALNFEIFSSLLERSAEELIQFVSFSTDETLAVATGFPNVDVLQRRFDSFAGQYNFGLAHIRSEWVLSLDADYVLSDELCDEIANLSANDDVQGYSAKFRYCVWGKPLRASLYPPRKIFEGWRGWYYVFQRTLAEILLSLRLIEAKHDST